MKYVIRGEKSVCYTSDKYLSKVRFENSPFPSKEWTFELKHAIMFNNQTDAQRIVSLVKVNTPEALIIEKVDIDEYLPYKDGDKQIVIDGKAEMFFKSTGNNYYHTRIICFDRKGVFCSESHKPLPLVALVTHPIEGEILMEATLNGMVWNSEEGMHQALYLKYKK